MSEVGDACQVIMISGRMIMTAANLSLKLVLLLMKVFNTIYLGKWKGSTGLQRFRSIKGEDYEFINVCSEDPARLLAVEKEMESHNLLFARLPDLCGGDGNTQYVIARSDLNIFAAFLMDHAHGDLREVKVGPVTESDYARTAVHPETGEHTEEFKELNRSAKEEYKKQADVKENSWKQADDKEAFRDPDRKQANTEEQGTKKEAPSVTHRFFRKHTADKGKDRMNQVKNEPEEQEIPPLLVDKKQEKLRMIQYGITKEIDPADILLQPQLRMREEQILHKRTAAFLYDPPIRKTETWAMFPLWDGDHVVVVPRDDLLEGNLVRRQIHSTAPMEKPPRAMLFPNQNYLVADLRTGTYRMTRGRELLDAMTILPAGMTQRESRENLPRLTDKDISPARGIPIGDKTRGGR